MSSEVRRESRRVRAFQELEEAWKLLEQAAKKGLKAARALQLLEEAQGRAERAASAAQPTTFKAEESGTGRPRTLRDGLPADVRRAIHREAEHLKMLAARVKAVPVTADQRLLARVKKRKEKVPA